MQRFIQMKVGLTASVTAAVLAVSTTGAAALTLVEQGAPRATIVMAQRALNPAKDDAAAQKINVAAHDVQDYVKKMSGAVLPLV